MRPEALSHTLFLIILVDKPRQYALQKHTASVSPQHLELLTVSDISSAVALKCQFDARVWQAHHLEALQRPQRTHNGPSPPLGVCVCLPANLRYMLRSSRLASADRTLNGAQRISVAVPFSRSVLQCTRPQSVMCTANRTERVSIEDRRFCHAFDRTARAHSLLLLEAAAVGPSRIGSYFRPQHPLLSYVLDT